MDEKNLLALIVDLQERVRRLEAAPKSAVSAVSGRGLADLQRGLLDRQPWDQALTGPPITGIAQRQNTCQSN